MEPKRLQEVSSDASQFREAVDALLATDCTEPQLFCDRLYEIWITVSRLYLDMIEVYRWALPNSNEAAHGFESPATIKVNYDSIKTEQRIRVKLQKYLEELKIWDRYNGDHAIPIDRGLKSKADYVSTLSFHLPEIYAETISFEKYVKALSTNPSAAALAGAMVSAQHLGKHHASYVLPALEWLTNLDAWR